MQDIKHIMAAAVGGASGAALCACAKVLSFLALFMVILLPLIAARVGMTLGEAMTGLALCLAAVVGGEVVADQLTARTARR